MQGSTGKITFLTLKAVASFFPFRKRWGILMPLGVRIADFSMAVTVVDHVVARPPQVWGFMEAISEVWGCSAGGVK
jgi:hypothetical protein